jgi:beta-xylosidase
MNKAQAEEAVWSADLGNGHYRNPVLYADYSDPDIVRFGDYFYMVASSFNSTPGLPILQSPDLVNWTIIGHAIDRLPPEFDQVRHGGGVWAPSIRVHDGQLWIYFSDPDAGIYMCKADKPEGPWSPLHLVKEVKGWIDPCPLWDDDGQAYLVHAFAGSRAGIKHKLKLCRMSPDGRSLLDEGQIIFDGTVEHPTLEGPKFYKRNGYYYIFAPAGGVPTGWQAILRSKDIYGPYEDKIVLHQGNTNVNGPHQGGYVELDSGEAWFMHFQDRDAYGRIVHLQPMSWEDDWPVMGVDTNGDGIGEPVMEYRKPNVEREWPAAVPSTSDEFDGTALGLQWQWQANWNAEWYTLEAREGHLRLYAQPQPKGSAALYDTPHILCQKFPAPVFTATAKLELSAGVTGIQAGLTVFGHEYAYTAVEVDGQGVKLIYAVGKGNGEQPYEEVLETRDIGARTVYLRVSVELEGQCRFSYSLDGVTFHSFGDVFTASVGGWVGAKLGLFCNRLGSSAGTAADVGYADIDWFRVNH